MQWGQSGLVAPVGSEWSEGSGVRVVETAEEPEEPDSAKPEASRVPKTERPVSVRWREVPVERKPAVEPPVPVWMPMLPVF